MADPLESSPFGRKLSLLIHRLPRPSSDSDWDWELERGFHLQVLSEDLFALSLRPREDSERPSLPLLMDASQSASGRLLVWQKAAKAENWDAFSAALSSRSWQAGLILSANHERGQALSSYLRRRSCWKGLSCPVIEVFQDSPPATFFTVEKNLFVLGRVGRRMRRYARLRGWLPW